MEEYNNRNEPNEYYPNLTNEEVKQLTIDAKKVIEWGTDIIIEGRRLTK